MPTTDDRLIAGTVSTQGLVTLFGDSTEKANGVMTILSVNDWVARINSSSYKTTGPTGAWAGEWWSVYNYLQYGGVCKILQTKQNLNDTTRQTDPWSENINYQDSYDIDVLFGTNYISDNLYISSKNYILYFIENKNNTLSNLPKIPKMYNFSTEESYTIPQFIPIDSDVKKLYNNDEFFNIKHNCYIKSDGTVVCFGDNTSGQCDVPVDLTNVKQVSCGGLHTMALKTDGTVVGWGNNSVGQITPPGDLTGVKQVTCGDNHTCLLKSDGTVVCFGRDTFSSNESVSLGKILGNRSDGKGITSTNNDSLGTAVKVNGITLTNINYISATVGGYATQALGGPTIAGQTNGLIYKWGSPGTTFTVIDPNYTIRNGFNGIKGVDNVKLIVDKKVYTNVVKNGYFNYNNYLLDYGTSSKNTIKNYINIQNNVDIIDFSQLITETFVLPLPGLFTGNSNTVILGNDNKLYNSIFTDNYDLRTSQTTYHNYINGNSIFNRLFYISQDSNIKFNTNNIFTKTINFNISSKNFIGDNSYKFISDNIVKSLGSYTEIGFSKVNYITKDNLLYSFNDLNTPSFTNATKINGITITDCREVSSGINYDLVLKTNNTVLGFGDNSNGNCLGTTAGGSAITGTPTGQSTKINGITLTGVKHIYAIPGFYDANELMVVRDGNIAHKADHTIESWGNIKNDILITNKNITDINIRTASDGSAAFMGGVALVYSDVSSQNLIASSNGLTGNLWGIQNEAFAYESTKTNGLGGITSITLGGGITSTYAALYQNFDFFNYFVEDNDINDNIVGGVLQFYALAKTLPSLSVGLYNATPGGQYVSPSAATIISGPATISSITPSNNNSLVGITGLSTTIWSKIQIKFPEITNNRPSIYFYPGNPAVTANNKELYISNIQFNEGSEAYSYVETILEIHEDLHKEVVDLFTGEKIDLPYSPVSLNKNKIHVSTTNLTPTNYVLLDNGKIYSTYEKDYLAIDDFITSFYYKNNILVYNTTNNKQNITTYIGNSFINDDYTCIFPEQKVITNPWSATDNPVVSVSSDAAGCLARNYATTKRWSPFSGINRGKLLNSVNIQSNSNPLLTPTVKTTSLNEPYFDINKTFSEKSLNTQFTYSQIQKRLNNAFIKYKFELNTEETRLSLANDAKSVLDIVKNENGLTSYVVICNETNNTQTTISEGNIIVDITINFFGSIETVTYQVSINNETIDIFNT